MARACAASAAGRTRGFTLIELVGTMVIIGLLAIVVLPRFSTTGDFQSVGFRDEVVAALRYGQKTAVSRRRLVCANFTTNTVTLAIAAANPAAVCGSATVNGPDGQAAFAGTSAALLPAGIGPILFQPSGVVTNAAGVVTDHSIPVSGATPIFVAGATAYVE